MCFYDKGILKKLEKNPNYNNSWTIYTTKGKHFTNSAQVARQCKKLIGLPIALDIMRMGRVIGIKEEKHD